MDFLEIRKKAFYIIDGVRALGVARELHALPSGLRLTNFRRLFLRTHLHMLTGWRNPSRMGSESNKKIL
jgi:hypothetical protein